MLRISLKDFQRSVGKILKQSNEVIITLRNKDKWKVCTLADTIQSKPSEVRTSNKVQSPEVHTSIKVQPFEVQTLEEKRWTWADGELIQVTLAQWKKAGKSEQAFQKLPKEQPI